MAALKVAVIGLGRFGRALVDGLVDAGVEVLAIDSDMDNVEAVKDVATYAVRMDASDVRSLRANDLDQMDVVVVTIGESFEAAVLTVQELISMGITNIYARAISPTHRKILERMAVTGVISPTEEAGKRFARRLAHPGLLDYIELAEDYEIAEAEAPPKLTGHTLGALDLTRRYHVTVVTIRRPGERESTIIGTPTADTQVEDDDVLILAGRREDIQRLIEHNR